MWTLLKSEMDYHKNFIIGFFTAIPLLAMYSTIAPRQLPANYLLFWLSFLMIQIWTIQRNKEKRERLLHFLPVKVTTLACMRIGAVIIPGMVYFFIYYAAKSLINPMAPGRFTHYIIYFGILLFGFSFYHIIRDVLYDFFRERGVTLDRMRTGIMFFILGLNLLGIFMFLKARGGRFPISLGQRIDWVIAHNPFAGDVGFIRFVLSFSLLALMTIVTYNKRRAYLE